MLVKLDLPPSEDYPAGKQVWVHAEDIDRVEGHSDWKIKETKVYLKRNPTEPFLIIKKAIVDVVSPIDNALSSSGRDIRALTEELRRIADELVSRPRE